MRMACTALSIVPCAVTTITAMVCALVGQLLQQFQAAHARHLHVGDHDGGSPLRDFLQAFSAILGGFGPVAPGRDQFGQAGPFVFFVFDDQYFFVVHSGRQPLFRLSVPGCKAGAAVLADSCSTESQAVDRPADVRQLRRGCQTETSRVVYQSETLSRLQVSWLIIFQGRLI